MGNLLARFINRDRPRSSRQRPSVVEFDQVDHPTAKPAGRNVPSASDARARAHARAHAYAKEMCPVRPLPPVPAKKRVRALYDFTKFTEDELPFKKGDVMALKDDIPIGETPDWLIATHLKTKKSGYIPSNYIVVDDGEPESQEWWIDCDREDAEKMLLFQGRKRGTFLLRRSQDNTSYVMSVRDIDGTGKMPSIKHYRLRKMDSGGFYIKHTQIFDSLLDLIQHYSEASGSLGCQLTSACPRVAPVVQFKDLEISRDAITLSVKVGKGCFGEVWKGKMCKAIIVAVKTKLEGRMEAAAFLEEARIMHRLSHKRLVRILAVVTEAEPFWIVTEYMANGALLSFLRSDKGQQLKLGDVIKMNAQIAEGMAYLERKKFIHRDLRAANILVDEYRNVKVADFGLARILESDGIYYKSSSSQFPYKWTAPEALNMGKFSTKSDVWSFGILMYEIITLGFKPYAALSNVECLEMVSRGGRMSKPTNGPIPVPDPYYEMMLKCWHRVPKCRPTFESLWDFFENNKINTEGQYKQTEG